MHDMQGLVRGRTELHPHWLQTLLPHLMSQGVVEAREGMPQLQNRNQLIVHTINSLQPIIINNADMLLNSTVCDKKHQLF
jgi:hypothetical protein